MYRKQFHSGSQGDKTTTYAFYSVFSQEKAIRKESKDCCTKEDKKLQGGDEGTYPPAKMTCRHDICQQNDIFMYELERNGISPTRAAVNWN